jgi:hypothetical protein
MSAPGKRTRFLSPKRIADMVWATEGEEAEASSDSESEDDGGYQNELEVSNLQPDLPTSIGQASSSSISISASDGFQSGSGQQVPSPSKWTRPSGPQRSVRTFTGGWGWGWVTGGKETVKHQQQLQST